MCYILWEEAKWKQCDVWDQYGAERAESLQDGVRIQNEKLPPPFSLSPSPRFITKILIHVLVLKAKEKQKKHQIWKWHYWLWVTVHASPFHASPAKAAGGSSKFLGWADNVEMLTTANLSRVSDLKTTAGDGERESNGFQLCPARLWQEKWARSPERSCRSLRAVWIFWKLGWM